MYYLAEAFPFVRRWRLPLSRDQVMLLMAAVNLIFLGIDIYLAHDMNGTIVTNEWIPIIFGPTAGVLLLFAGLIALRNRTLANLIATVIFFACLIIAGLGSYFHLHRALLPEAPPGERVTTALIVWAPPLLGPLTFALVAVLGLSAAWIEDPIDSGEVSLLGNFKLHMPLSKTRAYFLMISLFILATVLSSVMDHGRTGFINPWLWLPTFAGIFATVAAAAVGIFNRLERGDLLTYAAVMFLLMGVGLIGAWLHITHNLTGQGAIVDERFLRGAPLLAPLLFANMGLLGLIALLDPKPGALKENDAAVR
ncbi:MAG TPA: hypothetical protein VF498_18360 [Anaerolineales bacterium]